LVRKVSSMNLASELIFSEADPHHSLGENSEKCLIDVDLRPSRGGTEKIFSLFYCLHCAYTERGWKVEAVEVIDFWWAV
jgi:hypothetical protein